MGTKSTFTKQLAAASANCIAASQSGSAGTPLLLNGSASNYLSTTSSAALPAGGVVLQLNSVTGLVVGQSVSDSTNNSIPTGTNVIGIGASSVTLSQPVGGTSGVANGDTIVFPGTAIIDTATAANVAIGRRVAIAYTGTDTNFTIVGTNSTGNVITDTAVGSGGAAQSNMDFVTVTSVTPVGGGLTGVTVGTNGVGSSPWCALNWRGYSPMNVTTDVEIVSGSVNYTIEHTNDDPNGLPPGVSYPLPFPDSFLVDQSATIEGAQITPTAAMRVTINSGTGEIRVRFLQAGVG